MSEEAVCARCILPGTFPGAALDAAGICSFCTAAGSLEELSRQRAEARDGMERAIERARDVGTAYDCIVAFSGGKDSSYTLKLMVDHYRLRTLAITIDNGFLSDRARLNALAVTDALGVDLLWFRPAADFMNRLYRESAVRPGLHSPAAMKRASPTCNSCIQLVNTYMIRTAVEKRVPLIAGGYIGGQVPKSAAHLTMDVQVLSRTRSAILDRFREAFGPDTDRHLGLAAADGAGSITMLNPLLTVRVTEEEIVAAIEPLGWLRTADTGLQSSNCRLNDLGIHVHHHRYGLNPYLFEMAEQVRQGVLDRETALARAAAIPGAAAVAEEARRIGLDLGALP